MKHRTLFIVGIALVVAGLVGMAAVAGVVMFGMDTWPFGGPWHDGRMPGPGPGWWR